jgi:pimeloyl-ACP methyl ester carboxylesterase
MLVAFRSIVIAAKAIVLNCSRSRRPTECWCSCSSTGTARAARLHSATGPIGPVVPLLLFVILFGLSMDYHVFILSRIREKFDRGSSIDDAISHGIKSSAGVVTSAAIVMVAVFSIFGTLSILFFKQFGVGLATAILLDATIVRAVLLPATMKLLGEWNWYLPRWLEWLPRLEGYELEPVAESRDRSRSCTGSRRRAEARLHVRAHLALAIIALLVFGLGYLHFSGGDKVSVPAGAKAGDLVLEDCNYGTEKGSYAADCGTLVVPENRTDPQSRLIAVPVTRIRAHSKHPGEPIFRLEGGPGNTNMAFAKASRFAGNHDVVLVGYRGVDGSVRLDCPEVESALKHATDVLGKKFFRAYGDAYRACAARLKADGVDLTSYGLPQQVDDLEAARKALGYKRIDLLSESAGTRTALIYSWRYPRRIHRSVMIGVNPPGHFLWGAKTTNEQIARYAALCAKDAGCRGRPTTSPQRCGARTLGSLAAGGACRSSTRTSGSPASSG